MRRIWNTVGRTHTIPISLCPFPARPFHLQREGNFVRIVRHVVFTPFFGADMRLGGKYHTEIFSFRRPENGKYKGREWELIVKPVIEKWGKFVKEHHS